MKNKSKEYLESALRQMPHSPELLEVRGSIQRAIKKLEQFEEKQNKKGIKQSPIEQWKFELGKGLINPFTSKGTLETIDKMIDEEKSKGENEVPKQIRD